MKTPDEIMNIIQDNINGGDGISDDFYDYVHSCDDLTDKEMEWADENLGMHLVVEKILW